MESTQRRLLEQFEETLTFAYHSGNICDVPVGYTTGWRTVPYACIAQTDYTSVIHLDGERVRVDPHAACVIRQGIHHRIDQIGPAPGISRFAHINFIAFGCIDVLTMFDTPMIHAGATAERIGRLCSGLAEVSNAAGLDHAGIIQKKSLGFELLWTITNVSRILAPGTALMASIDRLRPVLNHIHAHLGERLTLARLAAIACLSPSRFHAVFKHASGQAPQHFVQRLRFLKAQQLLIETGDAVKGIAATVGYPDEFHFSRAFKKHCGMNPTTYRQQVRTTMMGRW
jgi:AraC-like DNA-binding protein